MASPTNELLPNESRGPPTIMYLIEINPNLSSVAESLPMPVLNTNTANVHYLVPVQESAQIETSKHNQHHEDSHIECDVNTNGNVTQIFSKGDSVIATTTSQQSKPKEQTFVERLTREYLHISDSVPPPRAVSSLPSVLRVGRGGVAPVKLLPPCVRFGPIQGVIQEVSSEDARKLVFTAADRMKPILLLSKNDTISHIDVSDKDISNWFSLLPLGDENTANVWLYQENNDLYGITIRSIAPRVNLCLGYSKQYAEQYRIPDNQPISSIDDDEEQKKWWCYECQYTCKSASLLQRHTDVCHNMGTKTTVRKRRYRCKHCALPFVRLFTLKRHMTLHCKMKTSKSNPQPEPEPTPTPDVTLNPPPVEEDRLPSDESFHNYTNNLDFSTNLFDTDRIPALDRSDLNLYDERDDKDFLSQSGHDENLAENVQLDTNCPETKNSKKEKAATVMVCPYCQETILIASKLKHMRKCRARTVECACGKSFPDRSKLARHVYRVHAAGAPAATPEGEIESTDTTSSYKCEQCCISFKRRGMLVNHMWRVHGVVSRLPIERRERHYPCVACPKLYRSAAKRDHHVRVHHPGAEVMRAQCIESGSVYCAAAECPACPRQYATRAKLMQHMRAAHPHFVSKQKMSSAEKLILPGI
ncbi:PR domain zinc finger protein 10-like isoform X2 [Amyelois transitella]|uniref:PR domain zinc finger protein 10-like isoform X2 n=1 Tax=Amyelois transitella TaxID=680683 RepID=UPI0029908108|nr:PR domain zinc finger protein 10-like isoform X2 [Amyelois transitella]